MPANIAATMSDARVIESAMESLREEALLMPDAVLIARLYEVEHAIDLVSQITATVLYSEAKRRHALYTAAAQQASPSSPPPSP